MVLDDWYRGAWGPDLVAGGWGVLGSFPSQFFDLDGDGAADELVMVNSFRFDDAHGEPDHNRIIGRVLGRDELAQAGHIVSPLEGLMADIETPYGSQGPWESADVGDLDGDGLLDIVLTQPYHPPNLMIFYGQQGVPWSFARDPDIALETYSSVEALFAGDLDGDGVEDLALRGIAGLPSGNVGVLRGGTRYTELTVDDLAAVISWSSELDGGHSSNKVLLGRVGDLVGGPGDDLAIEVGGQDDDWDSGFAAGTFLLEGTNLAGSMDLESAASARIRFPNGYRRFNRRYADTGDIDCDGQVDLLLGDPDQCPFYYPTMDVVPCVAAYAIRGKVEGVATPGLDQVVLMASDNVVMGGGEILVADFDGDGCDDVLAMHGQLADPPPSLWDYDNEPQNTPTPIHGAVWKGRPGLLDGQVLMPPPDALISQVKSTNVEGLEPAPFDFLDIARQLRFHPDLDGDGHGELITFPFYISTNGSWPNATYALAIRASTQGIAEAIAGAE